MLDSRTITKITLLILLLGLSSFEALSADSQCKDGIRLKTDLRGNFGPLRNQGRAGWCYAYASADLAGEYLWQKGIGLDPRAATSQISAAATALNYNEDARDALLKTLRSSYFESRADNKPSSSMPSTEEPEGGHALYALDKIFRSPICRTSQVSDDKEGLVNTKEAFGRLATFFKWPSRSELCVASGQLSGMFPTQNFEDISSALSSFMDTDPVAKLVSNACGGNDLINEAQRPQIQYTPAGAHPGPLDAVDAQLKNHRSSIVDYDSMIIGYHSFWHASVIVGSGVNCKTGEVEYLMRNSWGADGCRKILVKDREKYRENLAFACRLSCPDESALCRSQCAEMAKAPSFRCTDDGHFIVPRALLKTTIKSSTYLSGK